MAWTACMAVYWSWPPRLIQAYLQASPFRSNWEQGGAEPTEPTVGLEKKINVFEFSATFYNECEIKGDFVLGRRRCGR
ncbi:hypothetical protein LI328DRAFT_94202 [Trichoderma asperelloides]|nr:hypothetical protein LI328DRAFT_94202 [Trichoderma asperelloides]